MIVSREWDDPLPIDPHARLVQLKWRFLHQFEHEWWLQADGHTYAGSGWVGPPPEIEAGDYEHRMVCAEGSSANEAIDDWHAKLPKDEGYLILWRVQPEIASETDFCTKKTKWIVFSRFALVASRAV